MEALACGAPARRAGSRRRRGRRTGAERQSEPEREAQGDVGIGTETDQERRRLAEKHMRELALDLLVAHTRDHVAHVERLKEITQHVRIVAAHLAR